MFMVVYDVSDTVVGADNRQKTLPAYTEYHSSEHQKTMNKYVVYRTGERDVCHRF